ncbi:NAD(P)-dependent oxidoreductase [Micromonospora sp. KC723]|uniref:NAD-dependent epimerase/dehydratase family protein n=1 Tax=Micromonospora sp. KC723 TaxID=2530381 RepID=UPI00104FCCD2|nr:NAD(P)-dependent oxidoreductase [Micromonospora sp. KC723]TDB74904.1 NAD(P)-dependent oxidoreductase [Micromonospora sp. KC723]
MADRILITGGAGFVGLHLARRLLREGAEVTLLDDLSRGRADRDLAEVRAGARLLRHDLTAPIPPDLLVGDFDEVYHLAAVVGVRQNNENPSLALNVNLRAVLNLLDWCRRRPPGRVYLSSTSEVADGATRLGLAPFPVPEDVPFVLPDPTLPRASYGLSKIVAETLLRQCADLFPVRIGRYHNIYGPRMGHDHVIPHFVARALARQDPFPIYGAAQTRAFCHIDDAVDATVGLTRLPGTEPVVANIGNDTEEIVIRDLAEQVVRLAGYAPTFEVFDPPPGSPDRRLPDLGRLRRTTGYAPRVDLSRGLRQTFDWYAAALGDDRGAAPPPPVRKRA